VEASAADLMAGGAKSTTIPPQQPGLSSEIPGLLEDTLNRAVRAASAQVPSAATTMADRKGAIRHAVAPALVAAEDFMAVEAEGFTGAVVVAGNRKSVMFPADREMWTWREAICGERSSTSANFIGAIFSS
jgi:hypothetical protein